jgi:hypothetical protein
VEVLAFSVSTNNAEFQSQSLRENIAREVAFSGLLQGLLLRHTVFLQQELIIANKFNHFLVQYTLKKYTKFKQYFLLLLRRNKIVPEVS